MIFSTISNKMLSPPRSSNSSAPIHLCKTTKFNTWRRKQQQQLQLHLLVVLSIIVCTQAGVINKKREIPFALETTESEPMTATTTPATITVAENLITTTAAAIIAKNDFNSENSASETNIAEPTTHGPSTKLFMQSKDLKDLVANEIALHNETEKALKQSPEQQQSISRNDIKGDIIQDNLKMNSIENSKNNIESNKEGEGPYNFVYSNNNNKENKLETKFLNKTEESENAKNSDIKIETTTILNLVQTTTPSAIKDISIESNHIMPIGSKTVEVTTEYNLNLNKEISEESSTYKNVATTVMPSKIPHTLDKDSLREISNDLPEKTTESYNLNKVEHEGRSMSLSGEEGNETTLKPEIITTSPTFTMPLEQLRNSIDTDEFTRTPSIGEKKGKFINDNSTNAQKLNLPNNAEVWSLAGMKPQMATPGPNVTIATSTATTTTTTGKQNETIVENVKNTFHTIKTTTANILDLNNSEKNLLDWSHIINLSSTLKNIEDTTTSDNKNLNNFEHTTPLTQFSEEDLKNSPLNSVSNDNNGQMIENLANYTTILSKSSFDNIPQENLNNKNSTKLNVSNSDSSSSGAVNVSSNNVNSGSDTTETVPLKLDEINLTLNKTLTNNNNNNGGDEHLNKEQQHNVNDSIHTAVTLQPIIADESNKQNSSAMIKNTSEVSPAITASSTEPLSTIAESTAVDSSAVSEPSVTFSTLETVKVNASNVSGERKEIVDNNLIDNNNNNNNNEVRIKNENNKNYANNENENKENTNNNLNENINLNDNVKLNENTNINLNENENNLIENKKNINIFATTTKVNLIPITTYKPNFMRIELNPSTTTTTTTEFSFPSTSEVNSKKPVAEVDDQNGNEIESKKSINIESNETTTTKTTTENSISAFGLNISSTTITTHLNEQVFETTTVTPTTTITAIQNKNIFATTETSSYEKTTSSAGKDETKISGREEDNESSVITTPKTTLTATTTLLPPTNEPEPEHLSIGSSSTTTAATITTTKLSKETNENEKEIKTKEFETSTENKTPVVEQGGTEESFKAATSANGIVTKDVTTTKEQIIETSTDSESDTKTTATPTEVAAATKAEAAAAADETTTEPYQDTTTTIVTATADTQFKNPIDDNKGSMKEEEKEYQTVEPKKNEQQDIDTTTTSMPTTTTTTTTAPITSTMNIKTTAKYIIDNNSLDANEKDNSINEFVVTTTTSTSATTEGNEEKYKENIETTTSTTTSTTPTPPSPSRTTTESELKTTEINETHSPQSTTESTSPPPATSTTLSATEKQPNIIPTTDETEIHFIPHHTTPSTTDIEFYSTIRNNFQEEFITTTTMLPTNVITADIGGGQSNGMPPLITTGSSGNSMYPKNTDGSGETDVNVIIAITVSVIGVIALILLVAFLYLMRKRQKQTSYSQRCRPVSLDEYAIDNVSVGGSMRKGSIFRSSKRTYGNLAFDDPSLRHNAMGVHELAKFSTEKLRIFEEFRDVPQITAREDEVPQGCEDKNRYANVLPLPESRVILQRLNDDEKTEYINANYVTGPKDTPNYYIACQAPMESTVEDFWRMIWEQQSRVIIQATDLIENGVEKCAEYLPPSVTLDNHSTFGDFQITLQNREVKDKYAISTLLLKHCGENVTRELTHYWYKWPETGVPTEEAPIIAMLVEARSSLISYAIEQANEDKEKKISNASLKSAEEGTATAVVNNNSAAANGCTNGSTGEINGNISLVPLKKTARNQGPLTIHCSPGTGRTGTIIACDIAIRSLEAPKRIVDIPHIVYYVRRGRASSVLTKEQYEFIYKVANVYAAKISNPSSYN